jgi:hypothetical protein
MAHQGLKVLVLVAVVSFAACGGAPANTEAPLTSESAAPIAAVAAGFPDEPKLAHFRSKRFGMTVPLPDGRGWKIDDHTRPELVATHAATNSRLVVSLIHTDEPMNRQKCQQLAHDKKLVADARLHPIEDTVVVGPESYDTHVVVAIVRPDLPGEPLVGHVFAFGGVLRSCFVFDFSTAVASENDEQALSARLAIARTRVLDGITIPPFGQIQEEKLDATP